MAALDSLLLLFTPISLAEFSHFSLHLSLPANLQIFMSSFPFSSLLFLSVSPSFPLSGHKVDQSRLVFIVFLIYLRDYGLQPMVGAHKDRKMNLTQFPASGSSLSSRGSETGARVVMSRGGQCSELGERQI